MNILFAIGNHWRRWRLILSLFLISFITLSLVAGRVLLPQVSQYHAEIEKQLSRSLGTPVQFQNLDVTWHGWKPWVTVDHFQLGASQNQLPWVRFDKGFMELNLLKSLLKRHIVVSKLRLSGLRLIVEQNASGNWRFGPQSSKSLAFQVDKLASRFSDLHALDVIVQQATLRPSNKIDPVQVIRDLRMTLRRDNQTRRLVLVGNLPKDLGQQAQVVLEWQGNIHSIMAADVRFYFRGEALQLANWPFPEPMVASGHLAFFEAWGDWQQGKVDTLDGRVQINNLTPSVYSSLASIGKLLAQMPNLSADFSWRRRLQGWKWQGNLEGKDERGATRLQSAVQLQLKTPFGKKTAYLEGYCSNLPLADITNLAKPWLQENSPLVTLQPQGRISALAFRMPFKGKKFNLLHNHALAARFQDVITQPWQRIPGAQGLQGILTLDQKNGRVELDSQQVRLTGDKLLRAPIILDRIVGPIRWRRADDGLHLSSTGLAFHNADVKAHVQGHIALLKAAASPYLNLRLTTQGFQLNQVRRYLPTPLMRPKLSAWLNRAFVDGRVTQGTAVLQGYAADFPFDNDQGLFEARFQLRDAILDYARRWPSVEALHGEVLFRNRGLWINGAEGRIFDMDIKKATAKIDDLSKANLNIKGGIQGPGAKMVNFLKTGPLAKKVGKQVQHLQVTGTNTLDLHLMIPLRKVRSLQVQGKVHFADGQLTLPRWKLDLTRIRGAVEFTRAGLHAHDLELALAAGQPARMDIATLYDQAHRRETRFVLQGRFGVDTLLGRHGGLVKPYLEGKTDWRVVVKAPSSGRIQLELSSDLRGMAVNLPGSLAKKAQQPRSFNARIEPQNNNYLFCRLTYGSSVQAAVELAGFLKEPHLARGELRIGGGIAQLPKKSGLMVIAQLPRFSLPATMSGGIPKASQWPAWLRGVEIQVGELALAGQQFAEVNLKVTSEDDGVALRLTGNTLAGRIYLPAQITPNTPIGVNLQHLWLSRQGTMGITPQNNVNPDGIPPLWVTVDDLVLEGRSLGKLRFTIVPDLRGLRLTHMQLNDDEHHITASGDWWYKTPKPVSRLRATLKSQNLGKTLRAFGYQDTLKEGKAEAKVALQWNAPFPAIAPKLFKGKLKLTIAQGRLLEVEPGLGRLVGLLNIGSLSRRLQLDFSDLFKEGLGFDQLKGTVRFTNGHAYNHVAIKAPAAQVRFAGRIGFQERDYRQIVTITPQVGSPLAIAGTIAGGPAVGAAVLFAESLFKAGIDQITRYQYLVTGSWDDPVVRPRKAPKAENPYSMRGGS